MAQRAPFSRTRSKGACVGRWLGPVLWLAAPKTLCQELGSHVDSLKIPDEFGCNGGAREAYVSCCVHTETKPVMESGVCTLATLGDGKTCLDLESVKLRSLKECDAQGAALVQVVTDEVGCAGGTTRAQYACCTAGAPLAVQ
ncbi:MAG: hypothetical protein RLZZ450_3400 [Pseudomonadota bacterium]|jgi:hypothetical protein